MQSRIIKLDGTHVFRSNWWVSYLAWLASNSGNWIETKLQSMPPFPAYWLIACMDGAPERVRYLMAQGYASHIALEGVKSMELDFRQLAGRVSELCVPDVKVECDAIRDGCVLGFASTEEAVNWAKHLTRLCFQKNAECRLPWNFQFHPRVAIATTMSKAFEYLVSLKLDEVGYGYRELVSVEAGYQERLQIRSLR
jgi:hypothetical protein